MFDRLSFVVGEALQNLRRHGFLTFAAIAVVAISLTIIGGLGYAYTSALRYAEGVTGRFDMYVLLRDGTKTFEISQTADVIRKMPGVSSVNWIPRDKAWARIRQQRPRETEGIDNPLPDAYKVVLSDINRGDAVAAEIRQLPAVDPDDGVRYMSDEQRQFSRVLRFLQWVGSLGLLLFLIAGILIYNTIRMAAISRKTEVRVMRLVGASRATVAVPFLLEGLIEGATGGFFSALFVWGAWRILVGNFSASGSPTEVQMVSGSQISAAAPSFPVMQAVVLLTALGAVYGLLCSSVALTQRLDRR